MSRIFEICLVGALTTWLLAACASYAALVSGTTDAQEASQLAASLLPAHQAWHGWPFLVDFHAFRLGLAGVAGALLVLAIASSRWLARAAGSPAPRFWQPKWQQAGQQLAHSWRALLPRQQGYALLGLSILTVFRLIISLQLVTVDDSASYEFFVRKSFFTVSAYYPAPNNHVFSNTISWLFHQLYPGYWWSMRLPVLLLSTASTAGWFLSLLGRSNFRVAALAATLFGLLELSLFYAAEGRGYALLLGLSYLGFMCTLTLTRSEMAKSPPATTRAWMGLALVGVLGLYTVPTFAYFLVAAYSWLGLHWLRRAQWLRLASLGVLGATTVLATALLYAPLLWVSGVRSLLQNPFVQPLPAATFFQQLPSFVWEVEGGLLGESRHGMLASVHAGSWGAVAVLVGFGLLVRAARRGRLPSAQAAYVLHTGVPALWFVVLPYALIVAQRVQAPTRTLLFKGAFMFLLVGMLLDWLLRQPRLPARILRFGVAAGLSLWVSSQVIQLYRSNELRLSYQRNPRTIARWLVTQPPGPILAPDQPWYLPFIQFFIHAAQPTSQLRVDGTPQLGVRYRYLIAPAPATATGHRPQLNLARDLNCEALTVTRYW